MSKAGSFILIMALMISGCAQLQFGRPFNLEIFKQNVVHGQTHRTQVQDWLGGPNSRGRVVNHTGETFERWMYYYGSGKLHHMEKAQMQTLEVQFDAQGVVRAYNWIGE